MSVHQESMEDQKVEIMAQTKELSRLLGMIPSDTGIEVHDPMTNDSMTIQDWLSDTRESFLKLSTLIGKALDIQLQ